MEHLKIIDKMARKCAKNFVYGLPLDGDDTVVFNAYSSSFFVAYSVNSGVALNEEVISIQDLIKKGRLNQEELTIHISILIVKDGDFVPPNKWDSTQIKEAERFTSEFESLYGKEITSRAIFDRIRLFAVEPNHKFLGLIDWYRRTRAAFRGFF